MTWSCWVSRKLFLSSGFKMPDEVHVSVYLFSYSFDNVFWKHDAGKNSDRSWNRVFFPEEHPKITQTEMLVYFNKCVHLNMDVLIPLVQSNAPNSSGLFEQRLGFIFPLYKRCQNKVFVKNPQYYEWKFNQHILQSLIPAFLHTER